MNTFSISRAVDIAARRRPNAFARAVAWIAAPGLHELDARTLADIGASQTLRAQAELREAWRQLSSPNRWHA